MASPADVHRPLKRRRITRACDYCHGRSVRCQQINDGSSCRNCADFGQSCTFNRTVKRRGSRPKINNDDAHHGAVPLPARDQSAKVDCGTNPEVNVLVMAKQCLVMDLVELYFEIVYPIFPFFHRPSFLRRIARGEYQTDRSLLGVTMAVCALVSARVRDGAVSNPRWEISELSAISPREFFDSAVTELQHEPMRSDLNILRSHAILCIASIQLGLVRQMHYHLGQYHALVAMDGLYDETEWPKDIGMIEKEERRRLFWSVYTLDIYISIVWGGVARGREQQFNVVYPMEVDDELITNTSRRDALASAVMTSTPSWLYGWNFTTDLYRILEHALARFHESKPGSGQRTSFVDDIFLRGGRKDPITVASVRENVMQMYSALPNRFKEIPSDITFDQRQDLFGFQAANITATVQLLRMVLFSVDEGSVNLNDRCQIASEVIDAFSSIPNAYQRAISAPLLHHLGGIGFILGRSILRLPTDPHHGKWIYSRLRSVLLSLARLLGGLEGVVTSADVSQRLQRQAARIEERIRTAGRATEQFVTSEKTWTHFGQGNAIADEDHGQSQPLTRSSSLNGTCDVDAPEASNSEIMIDWGEMLSLPDNMFEDFTWAFHSI